MSVRRWLSLGLGIPLAAVVLMQIVPYGRNHTNPPAGNAVKWDSPPTEALARRACYDCHSNETKWPFYASVAPVSWRVQHHVDEGREKLNFSDFRPGDKGVRKAAGEAAETLQEGEMPPFDYLLAHAEARLSTEEKQTLIQGLRKTFATVEEGGEGKDTRGKPLGSPGE
jgi:hypothetical protein